MLRRAGRINKFKQLVDSRLDPVGDCQVVIRYVEKFVILIQNQLNFDRTLD